MAVHYTDNAPTLSDEEITQSYADTAEFNDKLRDAGVFVFAGGLRPADVATVVRHTGTDFMITDGPFSETKEHLAGFWVISAADLDEALEWARQATVACRGPVEVRPFDNDPAATNK